KKLKDYTKEEMNTFLYTKPRKIKNPPDNWPRTAKFEGLIHRFRRSFLLNDNFEKKRFLTDVERVVTSQNCPDCHGQRLNDKVLSCKINGASIADFTALSIDDAILFLKNLDDEKAKFIVKPLLEQMEALSYIGLNYLTLNRETPTMSGGESQSIKLIRNLSGPLTDLVYIIDEPSVGLHPEDIEKINEIMRSIRDKGNTVLIVEHDPDVIHIADHIIDIGPGAGQHGEEIIFNGTYEELMQTDTPTSIALNRKHQLKGNPRQSESFISLKNITKNNLKDISVDIPEGLISVITGVAGSGKSTLIKTGLG